MAVPSKNNLIILGRDARPSGKWISKLIIKILIEKGINVIDLGLSTTPSIGIYVKTHQASGGIIISASHNSIEWNALKLLNHKGEFLNKEVAIKIMNSTNSNYNVSKTKGTYRSSKDALKEHIEKILSLDIINKKAIKSKNYRVVVDGINSVGGLSLIHI